MGSGSPGRLPARGPHRSGRARLTHPAPRVMDSLSDGTPSLTHWSRKAPLPRCLPRPVRYPVEFRGGAARDRCLGHLSLSRSHQSAFPFLHGVPWGRFPRFTGTTKVSDSLPPIPPHFVSFVQRYRPALGVRSRRAPRAPPAGQGTWSPSSPCRSVRGTETTGSPRFLGNPSRARAPLFDSAGTNETSVTRLVGVAFRSVHGVGSREG